MMRIITMSILSIIAFGAIAEAREVHVDGYTRRDGTYVRPHVRSAPDSSRENNYGPSQYYGQPPGQRDHDGDGLASRYDKDDDNDGIKDNRDRSQYGGR